MIANLALALQGLAGPDVAVSVQKVSGPQEPLYHSEQLAMTRAVPSRIAEFTAGRLAARTAMQTLGHPATAIPMGPDRAPVWPVGLIGSISHSNGICAALVARTGLITGLGVDLESGDPLPVDLWDSVCSKAELVALNSLPPATRGLAAKVIFSAKECTYKCIYPQTRTVMGFDTLEIAFDPAGQFTARLTQPVGRFVKGVSWAGNFALIGGLIATVLVLR